MVFTAPCDSDDYLNYYYFPIKKELNFILWKVHNMKTLLKNLFSYCFVSPWIIFDSSWDSNLHKSPKPSKCFPGSSHSNIGLPPHSALPIRGKTTTTTTKKNNSAQISPYTKLTKTTYTTPWTYLRREETSRRKEFNLEAWEKETSNTISKK